MDYAHSPEQACDYAGLALSLMEERGIPAHPNNFAVWYSYFSGESSELKHTLDIFLDANQPFTEEQNAEVFKKFCGNPYDVVPPHLIAQKMEAELAAVLAKLDQAGRSAADYEQNLENASGKLSNVERTDDLKNIIATVMTQTRAMAEKSHEVESQLKESSVEIAQLKHELESARQEAMTDALTGLANRKMFDFKLREAATESSVIENSFCLLLLDLDHFKQVNDNYGHHVGDQVLRLMGSVLKNTLKGRDTAARYGGEEFAVVLPETKLSDAVKLAENIRLHLANKEMINRKNGERLGRITVSIGAAAYELGEQIPDLIDRADQALYAAKNSGRNRVVSEEVLRVRKVAFGT